MIFAASSLMKSRTGVGHVEMAFFKAVSVFSICGPVKFCQCEKCEDMSLSFRPMNVGQSLRSSPCVPPFENPFELRETMGFIAIDQDAVQAIPHGFPEIYSKQGVPGVAVRLGEQNGEGKMPVGHRSSRKSRTEERLPST